FFYNHTTTTHISTLSLHDALPIFSVTDTNSSRTSEAALWPSTYISPLSRLLNLLLRLVAFLLFLNPQCLASISRWITASIAGLRSEERFSRNAETHLRCRPLLEKK